jgi:hypothetical protein
MQQYTQSVFSSRPLRSWLFRILGLSVVLLTFAAAPATRAGDDDENDCVLRFKNTSGRTVVGDDDEDDCMLR